MPTRLNAGYAASEATSYTLTIPSATYTTGSTIVMFVRSSSAASVVDSIVDGAFNSYSLRASDFSTCGFEVWAATNITGFTGTITVGTTASGLSIFEWAYALEYGGDIISAPIDVVSAHANSATTDQVSSAFSTAISNEVVIVGAAQNGFSQFTAGTLFTLIEGNIHDPAHPTDYFGGIQEYYPAAVLSSFTAHMSSDTSLTGAVIVISLQGAGVTPPPDVGYIFRGFSC